MKPPASPPSPLLDYYVPDFAGWFKWFFHGYRQKACEFAYAGDEPKFLGVVPYDNWLFFIIVIIPATVFNTLLLWRCITQWREPKWVQNAAGVNSPSWLSILRGTTVEVVKTGHMCRQFMHAHCPGIIKFHNGVFGGHLRELLLCKDPRVAKQVLEEPNTRKPERGYRIFRRLHGYRGGKDFLSFSSHTDPLYKRTRGKAYKVLMKRTYDHYDDIFVPTVARHLAQIRARSQDILDTKEEKWHETAAHMRHLTVNMMGNSGVACMSSCPDRV